MTHCVDIFLSWFTNELIIHSTDVSIDSRFFNLKIIFYNFRKIIFFQLCTITSSIDFCFYSFFSIFSIFSASFLNTSFLVYFFCVFNFNFNFFIYIFILYFIFLFFLYIFFFIYNFILYFYFCKFFL